MYPSVMDHQNKSCVKSELGKHRFIPRISRRDIYPNDSGIPSIGSEITFSLKSDRLLW